jgi:HK97 family phage major capsid protein
MNIYQPKGATFTLEAKCIALAKDGGLKQAVELASHFGGKAHAVTLHLREAVASGWGDVLKPIGAREIFDLIREQSVAGRMSGLRLVPLIMRLTGIISGPTAYWAGAGKPSPVSKAVLATVTLDQRKIVAVFILSEELLRHGGSEGEALFRAALVRALSEALDRAMFDPAAAEVVDVSPASLTNGLAPIASTGNPGADIAALIAAFAGDLSAAYFVMHPNTAAQIATARDASGAFLFADSGPRGGSLLNVPMLTSRAIPWTAVDGGPLILVDPTGIAFGGGDIELATASQTSVQMSDMPADGPTTEVSLWQHNLVAMRATLSVNFKALRPSVAYVAGAKYSSTPA